MGSAAQQHIGDIPPKDGLAAAMRAVTRRHAAFTYTQAVGLISEEFRMEQSRAKTEFNNLVAAGLLVTDGTRLNDGEIVYSTMEMVRLHTEMLSMVRELRAGSCNFMGGDRKEAFMQIVRAGLGAKKREADKLKAIRCFLGDEKFALLSAPPGSGKLTVAAWTAAGWLYGDDRRQVIAAGPGREIAEQLAGRIVKAAAGAGIHNTEARLVPLSLDELLESPGKLGPQCLVMLDEAQIPDLCQYHAFLALCRMQGVSLRVFGDRHQEKPQGPGMSFMAMARLFPGPPLQGFFRQQGALDKAACEALWGEKPKGHLAVRFYQDQDNLHFRDTGAMADNVVAEARKMTEKVRKAAIEAAREDARLAGREFSAEEIRTVIGDIVVPVLVQSAEARAAVLAVAPSWPVFTAVEARGKNLDHGAIVMITEPTGPEQYLNLISRHKPPGGCKVVVDKGVYATPEALEKAISCPVVKLNPPSDVRLAEPAMTPHAPSVQGVGGLSA
ncbi:MAG: AAA family ATPase [Pseudomonadota bacterium]|nr:AAA family ATPase [Pseudomonadota bacterium]